MKNNFNHNLIKGRIAETVFTLLMRKSGAFKVLPFGYENTLPELVQYRHPPKVKKAIKRIRKSPDFVLISTKEKRVYLVEVKYRRDYQPREILVIAEEMKELWNPSWIFLATPEGFFFDSVEDIIKDKGKIKPLEHPDISKNSQKKYLQLLNDFEK